MKSINLFTVQMLIISCFLSFFPADSHAGGGHAHFGRSEFVNGGMSPDQMSQSLADIQAKTNYAKELLQTGNLAEVKSVATSIHDASVWIAENASMNRARHTNLKRASKGIAKAAEKLNKYAVDGNAKEAEVQVTRIEKLLEFVG